MAKGLIVSIDYTDRYCQACYYSERHAQPESISAGTDVMRYLIPSVLCYDPKEDDWAIGNSAVRMSEEADVEVFQDLMLNVRAGTSALVAGKEYSYIQLLAVYFGKLMEFIQIRTCVMTVENITVTMKNVDRDTKEALEQVFDLLKIPPEKIRLLSSAESFGYFVINENRELWADGAILFDFSADGFFVKQLHVQMNPESRLIYVDEFDFSDSFSVNDLASEVLRAQTDRNLSALYREMTAGAGSASVYFTGEGFDEQWFQETLNSISDSGRAFKGNNIYVKGACFAGFMRFQDEKGEFPIICRGRTRCEICVNARNKGQSVEMLLSPAAVDWYDAGCTGDFILEEERSITFLIRSIITGRVSYVEMDLSGFVKRPAKTTRIRIEILYRSELKCEISVTDKGFGDFYRDGGASVSLALNLEEYI